MALLSSAQRLHESHRCAPPGLEELLRPAVARSSIEYRFASLVDQIVSMLSQVANFLTHYVKRLTRSGRTILSLKMVMFWGLIDFLVISAHRCGHGICNRNNWHIGCLAAP